MSLGSLVLRKRLLVHSLFYRFCPCPMIAVKVTNHKVAVSTSNQVANNMIMGGATATCLHLQELRSVTRPKRVALKNILTIQGAQLHVRMGSETTISGISQ